MYSYMYAIIWYDISILLHIIQCLVILYNAKQTKQTKQTK